MKLEKHYLASHSLKKNKYRLNYLSFLDHFIIWCQEMLAFCLFQPPDASTIYSLLADRQCFGSDICKKCSKQKQLEVDFSHLTRKTHILYILGTVEFPEHRSEAALNIIHNFFLLSCTCRACGTSSSVSNKLPITEQWRTLSSKPVWQERNTAAMSLRRRGDTGLPSNGTWHSPISRAVWKISMMSPGDVQWFERRIFFW